MIEAINSAQVWVLPAIQQIVFKNRSNSVDRFSETVSSESRTQNLMNCWKYCNMIKRLLILKTIEKKFTFLTRLTAMFWR